MELVGQQQRRLEVLQAVEQRLELVREPLQLVLVLA